MKIYSVRSALRGVPYFASYAIISPVCDVQGDC